jgi:hypothetical protein
MKAPNQTGSKLGLLVRQLLRLPRTFAKYARLRRQQGARVALEAERLDRIRQPWKYRGR